MNARGSCSAPRTWIGMTLSRLSPSAPDCIALIVVVADRIKRQLRSKELAIAGSHWPIFVYKDERYDPENPWNGLFRNEILVKVCRFDTAYCCSLLERDDISKAFKHIFTSPSSVDDEPKATRSGNARIHGMCYVTPASLAYVFTQVGSVVSFTHRD